MAAGRFEGHEGGASSLPKILKTPRPAKETWGDDAGPCPSWNVEIQSEGGCHAAVTRLYPPLARKCDSGRNGGGFKPLAFSSGFAKFCGFNRLGDGFAKTLSSGASSLCFCLSNGFGQLIDKSERLVDAGFGLQ